MLWRTRERSLDLGRRGVIMGVLNVTPDSFSDGGLHASPQNALAHARALARAGAAIIDVGGESTRPGADPVDADEECRRVLPVIEAIHSEMPEILVSIDTMKAEVARRAVAAGASIINDVSAMAHDPHMPRVMADSGAGVVLMHMRGTPRTMQSAPHYDDVVAEVTEFLRQRTRDCLTMGIERSRIALDPGIGFGKTVRHNLMLLHHLDRITGLGRPVVLGVSRKSFLGAILDSREMGDREWPTVALTCLGRHARARVFRVHDPLPNLHALRMTEALLDAECD